MSKPISLRNVDESLWTAIVIEAKARQIAVPVLVQQILRKWLARNRLMGRLKGQSTPKGEQS